MIFTLHNRICIGKQHPEFSLSIISLLNQICGIFRFWGFYKKPIYLSEFKNIDGAMSYVDLVSLLAAFVEATERLTTVSLLRENILRFEIQKPKGTKSEHTIWIHLNFQKTINRRERKFGTRLHELLCYSFFKCEPHQDPRPRDISTGSALSRPHRGASAEVGTSRVIYGNDSP